MRLAVHSRLEANARSVSRYRLAIHYLLDKQSGACSMTTGLRSKSHDDALFAELHAELRTSLNVPSEITDRDVREMFDSVVRETEAEGLVSRESKYWVPRARNKLRQLLGREIAWRDEQGLRDALRREGISVDSVYDLTDSDLRRPSLRGLLLTHLEMDYRPGTLDSIVRALARVVEVLDARERRPVIIKLLEQYAARSGDLTHKSTIGFMAGTYATEDDLDLLQTFLMDVSNKGSRYGIVTAIGRLMKKEAVPILVPLLKDEYIYNSVIETLGKLKSQDAVPYLEPFLKHPESYTRQAAKKALRQCSEVKKKSKLPTPTPVDSLRAGQLFEYSYCLDVELLRPLLRNINRVLRLKLPAEDLCDLAANLDREEEKGFNFEVRYKDQRITIHVRIYMEDIDVCTLYVFSPSRDFSEALHGVQIE